MLVGGGELHETWESLTQTERPLQRGIQRFTGITQAMVDTAPPPSEVLPELAELMEGKRAGGPQRSLRRPRASRRIRAPGHRVARSAGGLHGGAGAALRPTGAPPRARLAGRRTGDRGRRGPPRPARRAHVRACLLRAVPQAVRQRAHHRRRARSARPAAAVALARGDRGAPPAARGPARPVQAAGGPGRLHLPRRARAAAVRGQVDLAALAGTVALLRARGLDREGGDRRLPPHQLGAGRAGAGEPADQAVAAAGQPKAQAQRRLRVPALPPGVALSGARGGQRAGSRGAR